MNKVIVGLALALAPGAAIAQQVPQPLPRPLPLPGEDSLVVPVVFVVPPGDTPARAALVGALEGAAAGAAQAGRLAERRPDCAPNASPGQAAVTGAAFGGVWGGLRGLLGRRHARVPSVLANERAPRVGPRPDPNRSTPPGPLANVGCVVLPSNTPVGDTR